MATEFVELEPVQGFVLQVLDQEARELIKDSLELGIKAKYLESSFPRAFYITQRLVNLFQNAFKIYLPVHLVILLIRLRRQRHDAWTLIKRTMRELYRSTLFTSVYAMSLPGVYCYLNAILGRFKSAAVGLLVSGLFSFAIFLEDSRRWKDIALFVGAQWTEAMLAAGRKRKLICECSNWQVVWDYQNAIMFSLGMAFIAYAHYSPDPPSLRPQQPPFRKKTIEIVCEFFFGPSHIEYSKGS